LSALKVVDGQSTQLSPIACCPAEQFTALLHPTARSAGLFAAVFVLTAKEQQHEQKTSSASTAADEVNCRLVVPNHLQCCIM
jgi:hypothetical protein